MAAVRSEGPVDPPVGLRVVATCASGVNRVAQHSAEAAVLGFDASYRSADRLADRDSGSLIGRANASTTAAQPGGSPQFADQRVAFSLEALRGSRVGRRVGLVEFLVDLGEPSSVGCERLGVEDISGVRMGNGRAGMAADRGGQLRSVDLDPRPRHEVVEVMKAFEIGKFECLVAGADAPAFALGVMVKGPHAQSGPASYQRSRRADQATAARNSSTASELASMAEVRTGSANPDANALATVWLEPAVVWRWRESNPRPSMPHRAFSERSR
jgi:hypothetical protein